MRKLLILVVLLMAVSATAQTQRRHAVTINNLTNTENVLLRALPQRIIQFCVIVGGAADETVVARAIDDLPVYATIPIAAGETKVIAIATPIGEEGLEVGTSNPAGDVTVSCMFSES